MRATTHSRAEGQNPPTQDQEEEEEEEEIARYRHRRPSENLTGPSVSQKPSNLRRRTRRKPRKVAGGTRRTRKNRRTGRSRTDTAMEPGIYVPKRRKRMRKATGTTMIRTTNSEKKEVLVSWLECLNFSFLKKISKNILLLCYFTSLYVCFSAGFGCIVQFFGAWSKGFC